jgi:hypothetical protein
MAENLYVLRAVEDSCKARVLVEISSSSKNLATGIQTHAQFGYSLVVPGSERIKITKIWRLTSSQTLRQDVTGFTNCSGQSGAKILHTKNFICGLHLNLINGLKCWI